MIKKTIQLVALGSIICLSACNRQAATDAGAEHGTEQSETKTSEKQLTGTVAKPQGFAFESGSFEGIGTIDLPAAAEWEKDGFSYAHKKDDITIMIQSQNGDFTEQIKDYTESFIDVNKKDAPKYEVTKQEEGLVNGVKAVKIEGKFNNGTGYVTRDYLFFTKDKVVTLMCRAADKSASAITIADYMASTLK